MTKTYIRSRHPARCQSRFEGPKVQPVTAVDPRSDYLEVPNGPRQYDRARDLPKLIGLWPGDLEDQTPALRERLVKLLRRALRQERQRGLAGHCSYDLARHASLLKAYKCEVSGFRNSSDSRHRLPAHTGPLAHNYQTGFEPPCKKGDVPEVMAGIP